MLPRLVVFVPALVALLDLRLPVLGLVRLGVRAEHVVAGATLGRRNGDLAVEVPVPLGVVAHDPSIARSSIDQTVAPYAGRMQLTPERLVVGGDAMARDADGRVVFVDGALPGELVEVEIDVAKKDFARGRVLGIIEPSPLRDSPSCSHRRNGCGGCDWMHLQPDAQLDAKVEIVRESLRRIGRLDPDVVDGLVERGGAVSPFGYRTTIRVVGGPNGAVGYRAANSNDVVEVTSCPIAASKLSRLLPVIEADEGAELTLRTSVSTGAITAIWDKKYRKSIRGVPPKVHIGERAWLTEHVAGHDLRVSAGSFFQSGAQAAELLVAAVKRCRSRTRLGAARRRRLRRRRVVRRGGDGVGAARDGDRVVEVGVPRRGTQPRGSQRQRGCAVRCVRMDPPAGDGPTPAVDVIVADPARPGLAKPGVAALSPRGSACSCW